MRAVVQDYTRALEQLEDSRMIDLFQRKYAHSLIVRLFLIPFLMCNTTYDLKNRLVSKFIQVGVGLMVLQQFGGVNAIAYYASAIFSSAGKLVISNCFI